MCIPYDETLHIDCALIFDLVTLTLMFDFSKTLSWAKPLESEE